MEGKEIIKFSPEGKFQGFIPLKEKIGRPHGLFISDQGDILLSDDFYHVVRRFDQNGNCLQTFGTPGVPSDSGFDQSAGGYLSYLTVTRAAPPFNKPTKMIVGPDGLLYASDGYGNAAIHVFQQDGQLIRTWGGPGQEPGHFNIPHSIWVDQQFRVWVVDRDNDRVQIFDREGKLLDIIDGLLYPGDVWSDESYIYVCEMEGRVSIYDMNLQLVAEIGHRRFPHYAHSMTGDCEGNLYLGVFGEHSIVKYQRLK